MSCWVGYVLIERGTARIGLDHHGSLAAVCGGPDTALAEVDRMVPDDGAGHWPVLDRLHALESFALIDMERRLLAVYDLTGTNALRRDLLSELRRAWPGFAVCWAYGEINDVAAYCRELPGDWRASWSPAYTAGWCPYEPWGGSFFLLTVDDAAYALDDGIDHGELLLAGPDEITTLPDEWLIENVPDRNWSSPDRPVPMPGIGLHLDTSARTVTGWTTSTIPLTADHWATAWPGWRWLLDTDRYDRHHARCSELVRELLPPPYPDGWWPALADFTPRPSGRRRPRPGHRQTRRRTTDLD
ncbi:MAG TPA: hypothetical protein VGN37_04770 [Actinocatenispora sp.]